jgi:ABC-type nitrate/sulfonate/bicarbonate transport system substrate-binding protein
MVERPQATRLTEIWHARCPVPTPLSLAVQLGWVERMLKEEGGVQLRSSPEDADPTHSERYYESTRPNSFRHGGSVPAICARADGLKTRVIGLSWTNEYQAVIALPQAGLTDIKQLRGRRIGIPLHDSPIDHSRASALRAFSAILATEGLSFRDVELIDLPDHPVPSVTRDGAVIATGSGRRGRNRYTSEVHALARGDVDAVYVKDASGAQATHLLGAMVIGNIGFHPDPGVRINNCTPRPLTVSQFLLDHHPEVVRGLLAQVVLAGEWACTHREETFTMVARETGWSESWVRYAYGEDVYKSLRLSLAPDWIEGLDTFKNFLAAQGFLAANFAIDAWIDPQPLQDVLEGLRHARTAPGRIRARVSPGSAALPPIYH